MQCDQLLQDIELGEVCQREELSVVPLFGKNTFQADCYMLDDALGKEGFRAYDSGEVSRVIVDNSLGKLVFIAAGMILEGASQNRAVKYPSLVSQNKGIELPVYCAERHRSTRAGSGYHTSATILMPSARTGSQQDTWAGINRLMHSTQIFSRTEDYTKIAQNITNIEDVQPQQVGYIAAVTALGRCFFYADVFGHEAHYAGLHKRLQQSVGQAAFPRHKAVDKDAFAEFLQAVQNTDFPRTNHKQIGDIHHHRDFGSALTYDGMRVQLSLRFN